MTPAAPVQPEDLYRRPNALAAEYSRFRVAERLLLTGHSHQAWPDRALAGQIRAFEDAAEQVDEKWSRAFAVAGEVARGYARRMGDDGPGGGTYALAANTHDLLIRFLSSLPLRGRPRLLTTDGEFHTIRRQLRRLEEDGWVEVERVPAADPDALPDLLAQRVDDRTAAVLVSSVLFRSARVVRGLGTVARAAERHGAELLVDVYHHVNALPLDLAAEGLGDAYVVGGGYKYCQLGEGNCFLRVPPGRRPRPVVTGWFAEFEALASAPGGGVAYGPGAGAFAGSTYDPTSHYRAAEVFAFFDEKGMTPELLRRVSQHQVGLLAERFDALDLDPARVSRPAVALEDLGGFLVLRTPHAEALYEALKRRGVLTDYRGESLRLGPAPYLDDRQLEDAIGELGEAVKDLNV